MRAWLTRIHRWTGLALVLFLVIVGFTGALLPFQHDIQDWLAPLPARVVQAPRTGAKPLDWPTLRAIAERRSGGVVDALPLESGPNDPAPFGVTPRPGRPPLGFNTIVLNPYTGRELPRDAPGDSGGFLSRIMPFLYQLHVSLALGDWGRWLLGIAALAWTIDCFVGVYLTLPVAPQRWWQHWRQAWKMRLPPRNAFRFNFDLHRAAGLWCWPMLFVFAWSSVGFNLDTVFVPVMRVVSDYQVPAASPRQAGHGPTMSWDEALRVARVNVAAEGRRRGFTVERERGLSLNRDDGTFSYVVRTSRDASTSYANSWFTLDGGSGRVINVDLPTGEHSGNTFGYWIGILHTAGIGGLPYRIFVSLIGVMIVALTVTGVFVWWKKRKARVGVRRKRGERLPAWPASSAGAPVAADEPR